MADLEPQTKNLRIAHLNIRSLRNKIPDIHLFLKKYKIHVLALTETHLGIRIKNSELKIDNYKLYRKDRKENDDNNWYRGGVALYVQDHIPVKKLLFSDLPNIEMIWADIYLPHTKPVLIGCCYISKTSDYKYLEDMKISARDRTEKDIFLLGDFNKNWFATRGKIDIQLFCWRCGLEQIVNRATREENCIDHIYTNIPELCYRPYSIVTGCSDHNLVVVLVKDRKVPQRITIQRSYIEFDKNSFIRDIHAESWSEVTEDLDPENALSKFNEIFMRIANRHAPLKITTEDHRQPWWWDEDLTDFIVKRDEVKKSITDVQENKERIRLQKQRRGLQKLISKKFQDMKKNHFHPESEVPKVPTNIFNEFLRYYNHESQRVSDEDLPLSGSSESGLTFVPVDDNKVMLLLQSLTQSVTPGTDEIDARLLKIAAPYISAPICHILNRSIIRGVFPSQWKNSKILLVSQSRNADFRPKHVLPVLSQILEKILVKQMKQYFDRKDQDDEELGDAFLGLTSFFDTISPNLLISTLKSKYSFSTLALSMMRSYLFGRKQKVYYNGYPSHWRELDCGLPPGS